MWAYRSAASFRSLSGGNLVDGLQPAFSFLRLCRGNWRFWILDNCDVCISVHSTRAGSGEILIIGFCCVTAICVFFKVLGNDS